MRAAIVVPSFTDFYTTPHRLTAMGPRIANTILVQCGVESRIFNFCGNGQRSQTIPLHKDLGYLSQYLIKGETGPTSYFSIPHRFGPSPEIMTQEISSYQPDICFIACFAYCYGEEALTAAALLKNRLPSCIIVCCGHGPSAAPETFLSAPGVDGVLAGEAEVSLSVLIQELAKDFPDFSAVPNFYYKTGTDIRHPKTLATTTDSIAVCAAPSISSRQFTYCALSLTRGCPKACLFCTNHLCHGHHFRTASLASITKALDALVCKPGTTMRVNIEDDNILSDPDFFFAALTLIKNKCGDISLYAENGLDYTMLTFDILKKLAGFGLKQLNISLGIFDDKTSDSYQRVLDTDTFSRVTHWCSSLGIPVVSYYICGLPQETAETAVATLLYLMQLPTRIGISLFYPSPSDALYQQNPSFIRAAGSSAYPWNQSLSTQSLITAFRLSRLATACSGQQRSDADLSIINECFKTRSLRTRVKKGAAFQEFTIENLDTAMVSLFFERVEAIGINPL